MTATTNNTIAAILFQIEADTMTARAAATGACTEIAAGNRNGAIGSLLSAEAEIKRLAGLLETVLTLHRTAR